MKRLLITGFAPFGGDAINPSWQAVQALPEIVGQWELCKRELPVTFRGAPKALFEAMDEVEPDGVLMVGLAGSRGMVTRSGRDSTRSWPASRTTRATSQRTSPWSPMDRRFSIPPCLWRI